MVELNFKAGDSVRLRLSDKEIDVVVLDSPDNEIVLVKLSSGYNIGIRKENILAARKLPSRDSVEKKKDVVTEIKSHVPKIAVVVTGGTIASKIDYKTGGVTPITNPNEFLDLYPELSSVAQVKRIEMPFSMLSENMNSSHWIRIAEVIMPLLEDSEIDGVVLTHGTDTLHYTGAALSFFFTKLNKPIVLTYSQKSIDRASSDAKLNMLCAAKLALSDAAEVMLVGHASSEDTFCHAYRATKVKKMHSTRRDAFEPVNQQPLARVWPDKVEFLSAHKNRNKERPELDVSFTDKVALLKYYPGQEAKILDYYALSHKGIVIEGTGLGHVSSEWLSALKKHIRQGLVACMVTQTTFGPVNPYVYSTGRELLDAGVIYLEDMLSETALVKLGFVLGHAGWKMKAKEKMLTNMAGELNPLLTE